MRFLIDECLHESLVGVAHAAGFEAAHVNYLGLSGKPDWQLADRIVRDEFTFVTNNRVDFILLFAQMELHGGLIIIVPNTVPALQRALFKAAIQYLGGRDLINTAIEVSLDGNEVSCIEYELPALVAPARPVASNNHRIRPVIPMSCRSSERSDAGMTSVGSPSEAYPPSDPPEVLHAVVMSVHSMWELMRTSGELIAPAARA